MHTTTFTQPGTLTLAVSDDATSDIDVQLLTSLDTKACVARRLEPHADRRLGTYCVLADTYAAAAGNYTLTATFTPSGQPCSAVPSPPAFNPQGKLGTACSYPGNQNLPYCNPNLEADTCIYTSTSSFCSKPCATNNDLRRHARGLVLPGHRQQGILLRHSPALRERRRSDWNEQWA